MVLTLQVQTAEVSLMIFDFQTWGYLLSIAPFSTHRIESSVSQVKHSDIFLSELSQVNTVTYFCLMPACFLSNIGGHLSCFAGQRKNKKREQTWSCCLNWRQSWLSDLSEERRRGAWMGALVRNHDKDLNKASAKYLGGYHNLLGTTPHEVEVTD